MPPCISDSEWVIDVRLKAIVTAMVLQHFSPVRHPSIADFAASALGALCGGLAVAVLLWRARAS